MSKSIQRCTVEYNVYVQVSRCKDNCRYNVNIPFWILLLIEQMAACYMSCGINEVICFPKKVLTDF